MMIEMMGWCCKDSSMVARRWCRVEVGCRTMVGVGVAFNAEVDGGNGSDRSWSEGGGGSCCFSLGEGCGGCKVAVGGRRWCSR
ncbi:hypothetical protein HanRHA438_Chr15g0694521 [Helianthus annuus]|nr:hypothetical protein HanRHA438_Chr15g0694521 [Helianthus annuus]